jgi:hypothetical protein
MRYKKVRVRYSRSWPQLRIGYAYEASQHALATQEIAIIEAEAQKG